jgi:alkanesulfonate monooxygenase SsuD/methylene tetrahydromethanopterin reductase-like flavin-dependent oxidoreductase (luciferase family)
MRYAIYSPSLGEYGDPRLLAELAQEAEAVGWDGFFIWDDITWPSKDPVIDPWVALAAMAMTTERIQIGPMVTALPRRRPWKLARETVSLDHLSGGRLILGVGLGTNQDVEFANLGEVGDLKRRAKRLEEGLEVLTGLWSGEPFSFSGEHYEVKDACFLPTPVQRPRIPIWVAATWPVKVTMRRANRWDGVFPLSRDPMNGPSLTAADFSDIAAFVGKERSSAGAFDIVYVGETLGKDRSEDDEMISSYSEAGVTWWLESAYGRSLSDMRERIKAGPPGI